MWVMTPVHQLPSDHTSLLSCPGPWRPLLTPGASDPLSCPHTRQPLGMDHSTGPPPLQGAGVSLRKSRSGERGAPPVSISRLHWVCSMAWHSSHTPLSAFPSLCGTSFQSDRSLQTPGSGPLSTLSVHHLPFYCGKKRPGPPWSWPLLPLCPSPADASPSCLCGHLFPAQPCPRAPRPTMAPYPAPCLFSPQCQATLPPLALLVSFFFDFSSPTRERTRSLGSESAECSPPDL